MSASEEERLPRPIGVEDESEEDSDVDQNKAANTQVGTEEVDTTAVAPKAAPEEAPKKHKSKSRKPAFSENDLVKDKGLRQVYNDFPRKCQYKGKGREVRKRTFKFEHVAVDGNEASLQHCNSWQMQQSVRPLRPHAVMQAGIFVQNHIHLNVV